MKVWRLCKRRHAAFDGEGARLAGGRWNRPGGAVVYTSESLALAALELGDPLVHVPGRRDRPGLLERGLRIVGLEDLPDRTFHGASEKSPG